MQPVIFCPYFSIDIAVSLKWQVFLPFVLNRIKKMIRTLVLILIGDSCTVYCAFISKYSIAISNSYDKKTNPDS
jgi:hypothetical protein